MEVKPPDKDSLIELLTEAERLLSKEKQVVEVSASRILFVGDTHGDVLSTISALRFEADVKVFLGDYVDRGPYQVENITLLLRTKLEHPDSIVLLRGNHETPSMNEFYGFKRAVLSRYGTEVFRLFTRVFSMMSYAVVVNGGILGVHGGIPVGVEQLEEIRKLPKGEVEPASSIAFQILWNDPDEDVEEFEPSPRGPGAFLFGEKPLTRFLESNSLQLLVRAHQAFPEGYRWFFREKLLSVFSCRFYPISSPKALLVEGKSQKIVCIE